MWYDKQNSPAYRANVAMFKGLGGATVLVLATYILANLYNIVGREEFPIC